MNTHTDEENVNLENKFVIATFIVSGIIVSSTIGAIGLIFLI
jgi:hypothetical protein